MGTSDDPFKFIYWCNNWIMSSNCWIFPCQMWIKKTFLKALEKKKTWWLRKDMESSMSGSCSQLEFSQCCRLWFYCDRIPDRSKLNNDSFLLLGCLVQHQSEAFFHVLLYLVLFDCHLLMTCCMLKRKWRRRVDLGDKGCRELW